MHPKRPRVHKPFAGNPGKPPPPARATKRASLDNDQIVFGIHAVTATLEHMHSRAIKLHIVDNNQRLAELAKLAKSVGIVVEPLNKPAFSERYGDDVVHQGAVLITHPFPYVDLQEALEREPKLCLVLDGVEDPRNLGRAARSAFAMGAELLIVPKDRAASITAAVEKAAVGTLAQLPVAQVTNLNRAFEELKKAGLWVIGTAGEARTKTWECDLTKPVALVIGNEEKGLRRLVAEACDELVSIPMTAPDLSLNAADAVTVLFYETLRQRHAVGSCSLATTKA